MCGFNFSRVCTKLALNTKEKHHFVHFEILNVLFRQCNTVWDIHTPYKGRHTTVIRYQPTSGVPPKCLQLNKQVKSCASQCYTPELKIPS